MARFLLHRLGQTLVVLLIMSFVVYALIGLMPGDPIDLMISANPKMTAEDAARLKALYGLDVPLHERYLAWLTAALQGDFGFSRLYARPVLDVIARPLAHTVVLMGSAFLVSICVALPAGILAAMRPHSKTDYLVNLFCFAGISVPPFWLALMLIILFGVILGVLPASAVPVASDPSLWERARHLVLPVMTLSLLSAGGMTRYVRSAMREVLRQDFIRTAEAKGMRRSRVVLGHALRNAMIPVVTILALDVGGLFSGALITEIMYAYPGMGKLLFDAVMGNDYNLASMALLFATFVTLMSNLGADAAYVALDPRVSFGAERNRA